MKSEKLPCKIGELGIMRKRKGVFYIATMAICKLYGTQLAGIDLAKYHKIDYTCLNCPHRQKKK